MATKILSIEERGKLYERMCRSIVYICEETDIVIGGGVFLQVGSSQMVLTAAHVVENKTNLHIVSSDKLSYEVQVSHFDQRRDVALVDVLDKPANGFECALLCQTDDLTRNSEIHFIGHPGRQTFTYNVGNISCVEKTCASIYNVLKLDTIQRYECLEDRKYELIDDFRALDDSVRLIQAKNVHGGGRFGGTGAPFLDCDGNIVGLYSFTFQEEDHAVHVAEVNASIMSFKLSKSKSKGKGKKRKAKKT